MPSAHRDRNGKHSTSTDHHNVSTKLCKHRVIAQLVFGLVGISLFLIGFSYTPVRWKPVWNDSERINHGVSWKRYPSRSQYDLTRRKGVLQIPVSKPSLKPIVSTVTSTSMQPKLKTGNHNSWTIYVPQMEQKVLLQRTNYVFQSMVDLKSFNSQPKQTSHEAVILIWTFGGYWELISDLRNRHALYSNCAYKNCRFTKNRTELSKADLVFFGGENGMFTFPKLDYSRQVTIFQTKEPEHWFQPFSKFLNQDNIFNYSMTYKTDSDIVFNYCPYSFPVSGNYSLDENPFFRPKTVLWFVSNCRSRGRMKYAQQLSKYIPVDIYGGCVNRKDGCSHERAWNECQSKLYRKYKFYLSFENSRCKDYITEKTYKVFLDFVIPIVMGPPKSDYEAVLPPNSFIHVDDFKSPADLAKYLNLLMGDENLFMKYHAWRYTSFRPPLICNNIYHTCDLCRLANEKPKKTLKMSTFWNPGKNCRPNT